MSKITREEAIPSDGARPNYREQVKSMSDQDLKRHAMIGRMCHCGTCFCCHAKFEEIDRRQHPRTNRPT